VFFENYFLCRPAHTRIRQIGKVYTIGLYVMQFKQLPSPTQILHIVAVISDKNFVSQLEVEHVSFNNILLTIGLIFCKPLKTCLVLELI
jgi:hypothetical protein